MTYAAEVNQYSVIDDIAEDRVWSGTITNEDAKFLFRQNDYGLRHNGELLTRLHLFTPQGRLVAWSKTEGSDHIRKVVDEAISKAGALYRPILRVNGDPTKNCFITINPDSVVYQDRHETITYPRRTDGSADLDNGSATARTICEQAAYQVSTE